jgi:ferrous iron transport protein A
LISFLSALPYPGSTGPAHAAGDEEFAMPFERTTATSDSRPLTELRLGSTGRVAAIEGGDDLAARLLDLGLTPGAEVVVLRRAPLGGALLVRVRDFALSMRRDEAARVRLSLVEAGGQPT